VADEDVALAGYVIVWDVTAGARIPATGTLASITSTGTAGQITVAINTLCDALGDISLFVATATCGTGDGLIKTSTGAATGHTFTITGSSWSGGSATNAYGINWQNSTGTLALVCSPNGGSGTVSYGVITNGGLLTVTGTSTGGSGSRAYGVYAQGPVTHTGNFVGGPGVAAAGIYVPTAVAVTLANGSSIISGSGGVGYTGYPPVWANATKAGYIQMVAGGLIYGPVPAVDHLWLNDVCGSVVGTLDMSLYALITNIVAVAYVISGHDNYVGGAAGTYHPTTVAEVLDTVNFGAASVESGTYHEAATTEVEDGIFFGPGSTYEGSFAGGGNVIIVED